MNNNVGEGVKLILGSVVAGFFNFLSVVAAFFYLSIVGCRVFYFSIGGSRLQLAGALCKSCSAKLLVSDCLSAGECQMCKKSISSWMSDVQKADISVLFHPRQC